MGLLYIVTFFTSPHNITWRIFRRILSVPHNIVLDLNKVMHFFDDMKHSISNEHGELAIDEPIEFEI